MKTEKEWLDCFGNLKAILTNDHFVYTSGRHGEVYVNKDAIYPHTELMSEVGKAFAEAFKNEQVEAVVAPALGGIVLTQWTGYHLSQLTNKNVLSVYAEKSTEPPGFVLKRGYDKLIENKRVLVLEDILNTGGSVKNVLTLLESLKVKVVGVAAVCNRGGLLPVDFNVDRLFSLTNLKLETFDSTSCPLCQKGLPINTQVGKGNKK